MKRHDKTTAAKLASRCYDFHKGAVIPVTDPRAIAALARAFTLLLRSGGEPLAVPLSEAEALGFPNHERDRVPDGVTWLAVGMDAEGRASYATHSAAAASKAVAHEVARDLALSRLAGVCATPGFPMGEARGRA